MLTFSYEVHMPIGNEQPGYCIVNGKQTMEDISCLDEDCDISYPGLAVEYHLDQGDSGLVDIDKLIPEMVTLDTDLDDSISAPMMKEVRLALKGESQELRLYAVRVGEFGLEFHLFSVKENRRHLVCYLRGLPYYESSLTVKAFTKKESLKERFVFTRLHFDGNGEARVEVYEYGKKNHPKRFISLRCDNSKNHEDDPYCYNYIARVVEYR